MGATQSIVTDPSKIAGPLKCAHSLSVDVVKPTWTSMLAKTFAKIECISI